MDKYWMLYRSSKRRDLGEDFSNRKRPAEPQEAPERQISRQPKLFFTKLLTQTSSFIQSAQQSIGTRPSLPSSHPQQAHDA